MEEEFDLSQFKKVDENGEAQPIEVGNEKVEDVAEGNETEDIKDEAQVSEESNEDTTEEKVEDTTEEPATEEPKEDSTEQEEKLEDSLKESEESEDKQEYAKPDELFEQLDKISQQLSGGNANTLEEFFEDYKKLRDSGGGQFKDDFIKNAVEYYNTNGTLAPYLEATNVDYEKMSDEEVMRHNLVKSNPSISQKAMDILYKKNIIDKFYLDEDKFDEDEVELGKELLKAEAAKLRSSLVDEQKNFIQPEPKQEETGPSREEQLQEWTDQVSSNNLTKDLLDNKRILVEYNDSQFSYEVENPEQLKEMTIDNNKFFELFKDEKGNIDFDKWYRVLNYAMDPQVYDASLISHGTELGQSKTVENLENPSKPIKSSQEYREPSDPIQGLFEAIRRKDSEVKIIR